MVRKGLLLLGFCCCCFILRANNVRIVKDIKVVEVTSGMVTLEFGLAWENSWRDDFNWDAVWIFLKYKEVASGKETCWEPVYPESSGCSVDKNYACVPGTTAGKVAGLFIFRNAAGQGRNQLTCRLKWRLPAAYSKYMKEDFEEHKIIFFVQGIEMVFLPYKAYSAGDGLAVNGFCGTERGPAVIDGEGEQALNYWLDDLDEMRNVSLGATFPKGYRGVYVMKYEISQEQYINFLNTLKRSEQEKLVPFLNTLKEGNYLFGRGNTMTYRNGIVMARKPENGKAVRFACNMKKDENYDDVDDGKTVACNYMCPADVLAYCAWAGLRPMTELEYEKASRRLYPQEPEPGEYAWNNAELPLFARTISGAGRMNEKANPGSNVNGNGFLEGPVRCGAFAENAKGNQELSGGSYWGVMELSGNLAELCYNVNAGMDFNGTIHGSGVFSLSLWPVDVSYFGLRGGSFLSLPERLRTSDRKEAGYYQNRDLFFRDSTVGFRGVRYAESGNVNPGKINCVEGNVVCPGLSLTIASLELASVEGMEEVPTDYMWYVDGKLQEDENDISLRYVLPKDLKGPCNIVFTRKAVTALGEGTTSVTVRVPDVPFGTPDQLFEDPGSSIQVAMNDDWKDNVKHSCWLERAPSGVTVNGNGSISGLGYDAYSTFKIKVAYSMCPDYVYEKIIRIARNYSYSGNSRTLMLEPGTYFIQCWGGAGGRGRTNGSLTRAKSKGGYVYGDLTLTEPVTFYLYIGGAGKDAKGHGGGAGGWNGGAKGGNDPRDDDPGGGGGGATDIRLTYGNLYSRIMVAGGGGGGSYGAKGGDGGGIYGGNGGGTGTSGAGQTTGNALGEGSPGKNNNYCGGGGGAGGYMGSLGSKGNKAASCSAGGGSGFVAGLSGCNAVNASGNFTGQAEHYSGLIFKNAGMSVGQKAEDGKIRIERLR